MAQSIFDRLSKTDTYASSRLKEKVLLVEEKPKTPSNPSFSTKKRSSVFDRLSKTDTYASSKLKEKVEKPTEAGRPLFVKEIVAAQLGYKGKSKAVPDLKINHSNSTTTTCSSSSSRRIYRSTKRSSTVFDRLACTGTKSSLRKDKKSDSYVGQDDGTFGESMKKFYYRNYDKGCTTVYARGGGR